MRLSHKRPGCEFLLSHRLCESPTAIWDSVIRTPNASGRQTASRLACEQPDRRCGSIVADDWSGPSFRRGQIFPGAGVRKRRHGRLTTGASCSLR